MREVRAKPRRIDEREGIVGGVGVGIHAAAAAERVGLKEAREAGMVVASAIVVEPIGVALAARELIRDASRRARRLRATEWLVGESLHERPSAVDEAERAPGAIEHVGERLLLAQCLVDAEAPQIGEIEPTARFVHDVAAGVLIGRYDIVGQSKGPSAERVGC